MGGSGSALFTYADDYQASLPATTRLLVTQDGNFRAQLTWMELADLHLLRARETTPRLAYTSLPPKWVFIVFPTHRTSALICDGVQLRTGDIIFHSRGERLHQRTTGATDWGSIALTPAALRTYGRTLAGRDVVPPACCQILRPLAADWRRLLRLHAEAIRIAETKLSHLGHPEVARALEQDLIWALVTCLTTAEPRGYSAVARRHARILVRFEEALMARADQTLRVPEICEVIGVSERTLKASCSQLLGMAPAQYLRLRRFRQMSAALARADFSGANVAH